MKSQSACRVWARLMLVAASTSVACAQFNQAAKPTPGNDGMQSELVKTGLYLISGKGSNSVLRLSANGLIMVDGKLPGNYDALHTRARKISDQPIRALILTGCDASSTGTNKKFVENGTHIVVQENARQNLAACNLGGDTMAPAIVTYGREYRIHLGGVDAQLFYFGKAHSNSDTVVYFPNLKAVAIGDLFAASPNPDYAAGGSLVNWGAVLGEVLQLDFDVALPSTGAPLSRAELTAFKTKIDTLVSRGEVLVNEGVTKDQLIGKLKTDNLGWQLKFTPDQVDCFYAELLATKDRTH
jgi:cyclase